MTPTIVTKQAKQCIDKAGIYDEMLERWIEDFHKYCDENRRSANPADYIWHALGWPNEEPIIFVGIVAGNTTVLSALEYREMSECCPGDHADHGAN
jgi:hypothetical protein